MSRSFKKTVKVGVCGGTNTEFYRERDREIRRKNKEICREMLDMNDAEREEVVMNDKYLKDDWREPTDGSYLVDKEVVKRDDLGMWGKVKRYLKSLRPWKKRNGCDR